MKLAVLGCSFVLFTFLTPLAVYAQAPISSPNRGLQVQYVGTDANGVESYSMISQYNGDGQHILRVLEPDNPAPGVPHSFLYVLPVEPELGTVYGDGLETVRALDAQNMYNVTVIAPAFKIMPWYADHATDPNYRYESFMTLELQPWVKARLSTSRHSWRFPEQHWLLGFSKSGYGAMSLLLTHPDLFTLGAVWDFPANMLDYRSFGASSNYGTQENFDTYYRLSATFLDSYATPFLESNRIWINGSGVFRASMGDFDLLLSSIGIQHTTAPEVLSAHSWTSGWVPSALEGLSSLSAELIKQCLGRWTRRQRGGRSIAPERVDLVVRPR